MKNPINNTHPIFDNLQRISSEGIVILSNVTGLPPCDGAFVSPDYVICIGHRGHIQLMYDDISDFSAEHTVAVIFPNHSLVEIDKTDDYLATLIVVNASALNDPMLQIINHLRHRYEVHPNIILSPHEYRMIMNVVEVMQETADCNLAERRMLHTRQLEYLLRLLTHYRKSKLNEADEGKQLSNLFHANIDKHFRQHRDVGFYASLACLTPKYFSELIKKETGHTAAFWISTRVVVEAKMLLHTRPELSVQAIADMMGFDEQSSFSRYFRRKTGMSPSEFRSSLI